MYMYIWPARNYDEQIESDGRYTVKFESLALGEFFGLELLSINNQFPETLTVRSDQCVAENIAMYPQPFIAPWKQRIAVALLFACLSLVVHIFVLVIQFVLLQIPLGILGKPQCNKRRPGETSRQAGYRRDQ